MTATSASKDCCITSFYPGDGIVVPPAAGPVNCSNSQPSSYSRETDHVYAKPGDFMVEVQPSILGLCWGNPNSVVNATMFVPVTVVASGT